MGWEKEEERQARMAWRFRTKFIGMGTAANGMVERNAGLPPERRIEFRVGIHVGDVVEESDGDLMGDGVNIAARLEGVAKPGGSVSQKTPIGK